MSWLERCLTRTALLLQAEFFPGLSEAQIVAGLAEQRVQISAGRLASEDPVGQTAIAATALLVGQLGVQISIDLPTDAPALGSQPPFPHRATLSEMLLSGSEDLIRPFLAGRDPQALIEIVIGAQRPASLSDQVPLTLFLGAGDFACRLGLSPGTGLSGSLPFGAMLGAVTAAAEVLRQTVRRLAATHRLDPGRQHYLGDPRDVVLSLPGFELSSPDLGAVDMISAGAITNGLLSVLLRIPELAADVRTFDGDTVSADNLNRCGLFTASDIGSQKVEVLSRYGNPRLRLAAVAENLDAGNAERLGPLAARVLVGVDDIPSRWLVQELTPNWLGVAGTSLFSAVASEHLPGHPCAGCLHPFEDPGSGPVPTISFVSALAGLLLAHRALAAGNAAAPITVECPSPTWAWALALHEQRGISPIGLAANPSCPLPCIAATRAKDDLRRAA